MGSGASFQRGTMPEPKLYQDVRRRLVARPSQISTERVVAELQAARVLTDAASAEQMQVLLQTELEGMGILKPLFQPGVTDVLVNSASEIWVDGPAGLQRVDINFTSAAELTSFAIRIASVLGVRLDSSQPIADATFQNGLRFSALLPPLVEAGAVIAFRIPNQSFVSLENWNSIAISTARLREVVSKKFTTVISGATGAGKTTLLKALMSEISAQERVVTIEDQSELTRNSPHQISLQARSPNFEGIGEVTISQLLRQSLRLRPDRLLVGELRGPEVLVWLQAINTGHAGSFTTIHANSASHAVSRLQLLSLLAGVEPLVADRLIIDSVDLVLHCARAGQQRLVAEVLPISDRARAWI